MPLENIYKQIKTKVKDKLIAGAVNRSPGHKIVRNRVKL